MTFNRHFKLIFPNITKSNHDTFFLEVANYDIITDISK